MCKNLSKRYLTALRKHNVNESLFLSSTCEVITILNCLKKIKNFSKLSVITIANFKVCKRGTQLHNVTWRRKRWRCIIIIVFPHTLKRNNVVATFLFIQQSFEKMSSQVFVQQACKLKPENHLYFFYFYFFWFKVLGAVISLYTQG